MGMLFGFKAIAMHSNLSRSAKVIGAIVLDHYNKISGQCDPSINRLARLSGLNKSSVTRAIKELQKHGLIKKISHGGGHERNKYMPCFEEFYLIEERCREAMKRKSISSSHNSNGPDTSFTLPDGAELPPREVQDCDSSLRSNSTPDVANMRNKPISITNTKNLEDNCALFSKPQGNVVNLDQKSTRLQAALNRAEARLTGQINNHPKSSLIWANCNKKMHDAAVQHEMKNRGEGIEYLINELGVPLGAKTLSNF